MTVFDEATAAKRAGDGSYEVRPDERFAVLSSDGEMAGGVNGGVLLASVLRAVLDGSPHPHPVATSAHYLRPPRPKPARVEVTWLKQGRTAATARATLSQDGRPVLESTVTTGMLGGPGEDSRGEGDDRAGEGDDRAGEGGLRWTGEPPVLPPLAECTGFAEAAGESMFAGFASQVDLRLDPATTGWLHGRPAGVPEMRGYFRLREDREPDALLLALAVDALPPVVFGIGAAGWSPTVELTWHMRAAPAPGLLRVAARCRHVSGGWFDEEAEVWDSAGRLVAQSRQIARGRPRLADPGSACNVRPAARCGCAMPPCTCASLA